MRLIIKFSPEITIKSASVRLHFIKILNKNICTTLNFYNYYAKIKWYWDYIEILIDKESNFLDIIEVLTRIPGIHHIFLVEKYFFKDMYDIFKEVMIKFSNKLIDKNFCVRVKRSGSHDFTSQDLERYLGSMLCKNVKNTTVKLKNFEVAIDLEVKDNYFLFLSHRYLGLCGFPIGTQGGVLSLVSGGFDSGISSYMLMRRGCKVNYCFFKFGPDFHEDRVYEMVFFLWKKFGCSHSVKFISIDFSLVVNEILEKINSSQVGVILKRMMVRAAASIAKRFKISTLVTGEALGQVSSQTLINLQIINAVSDIMIFRPLIAYDKEDIISMSRKIGLENFSINIPEYCGIISNHATARSSTRFINNEEEKFDFSILRLSIEQRKVMNICSDGTSFRNNCKVAPVKFVNKLNYGYVVIDIRTQDEENSAPLCLDWVKVKKIPFYKLSKRFSTLDQSKMYLLYCGRGIMSHCQVLHLRNLGFNNVNVYLPS